MRAEFKLERTIQQQATSATPIFEFFFGQNSFSFSSFGRWRSGFPDSRGFEPETGKKSGGLDPELGKCYFSQV